MGTKPAVMKLLLDQKAEAFLWGWWEGGLQENVGFWMVPYSDPDVSSSDKQSLDAPEIEKCCNMFISLESQ